MARALLSDSYKVIDNLDALMATLDGIRQAGADVEFDGLDLTERRLYARVVAPQVRAWAPVLLAGYRSPFGGETYIPGRAWTPERARAAAVREGHGYEPGGEPVLFAGFVIANSEVGEGRPLPPTIASGRCTRGVIPLHATSSPPITAVLRPGPDAHHSSMMECIVTMLGGRR